MNNRKLITTILVAVVALADIGLITFYDINPRWTLLQGYAIAAGICLVLTIQMLGWRRILALAPAGYLMTCILSAACFFGPPFEGAHRGLSVLGHRVFHPSYFMPLAVVCILAWHQQHKSRTAVVLMSAVIPAMIVLSMPYLSLATLIMVIVCALAYPVLSSRPNANVKWIVALLCAYLAALKFAPVLYGRRTLADYIFDGRFSYVRRNLLDVLGKCSWFGYGNGDYLTYTISPIWENAHVHCAYVMGLWAFVSVLLIFILLGFCLCLACRRAEPGPRRTLVLGCSLVVILPPLFSFSWLVCAFPGRGHVMPFLSQGGSMTLASSAALGMLLAALRGDAVERIPFFKSGKMMAIDILLALFAAFSLAIALTEHPPKPIPWFLVPNPPSPKLPPPIIRGRIFAADNSVLASTTNHWQIRIDPQSPMGDTNVWTKPRIAAALSRELGLPYTNLIAKLNHPKNRYILLKETRDGNLVERLKEHAKDWRLVIEKYQGRVYPLGEMAAHYVGAAGTADACYWERKPMRGIFGVEYTENEALVEGHDIRLPLVPTLQTNLWAVVKRLRETHNADAAWAVVLTATNKTPRILAMTKCPSYDPHRYGTYREPQWENAPARFGFDIDDFAPWLIPSGMTNDMRLVTKRMKRLVLNPPVGTNAHIYASALQLARAAAIVAAEEDGKPYCLTSIARSERPSQPVAVLLVQRDEHAIVICVRAPMDTSSCKMDLVGTDIDELLKFLPVN